MPNRLSGETSPYLLQHAHNPVDWYPWGAEAIERARAEHKPILLSVGYSACHWCHVMERESFEDDATARLMNEHFVNVKVDREERPDVDAIYMQAVQAMTGHGGWPMTVFLTPALEPFWGGTYFPPQDRHGIPSFRRVLSAVSDAWRNRPDDVQRVAASMREMYTASAERARASGSLSDDLLERATRGLLAQLDHEHGGFGDAPKFPQAMAMEFLLQRWARTGNEAALEAARFTFQRMARGGIHDQVGGGFARYAVDARWLVPHFEKMLYDNALLLRVGTHLLQAIGPDDEIHRACNGIVQWLRREMTAPEGGFYSSLDADSEGEEGRFYVWEYEELRERLGADAGDVLSFWGASPEGNFEGRNILHVTRDRRPAGLDAAAQALFQAREGRVRPGRDDKILASWNGLMLRALAEFARCDGSADARALAVANGDFLRRSMTRDGATWRTHKDGVSRIGGFLEDHAAVALGMLALYELTYEHRWLDAARRLAEHLIARFWDDAAAAFFDTTTEHAELPTRPRDVTDNATPSGTSLAVELLLRLGDLLGEPELTRRASFVLETLAEPMARFPLAFGHALCAADFSVNGAVEVAITGDPAAADFAALDRAVARTFVPSLVLAGGRETDGIALLADRPAIDGRATAYVCRGYACERPVTDPVGLFEQLASVSRRARRP